MSIQLKKQTLPNLTVLRGKNLSQLISKLELSNPEIFKYHNLNNGEFVANLGQEEILINLSSFSYDQLETQQYAFQRGDVVINLSGNWRKLMSEVCVFDFRQARPGDFVMVLIAGVGAWMLIPQEGEPVTIGCDPTYGEYFIETLEKQIHTSPFLN
ncbi:hypothetical protein [Thiomicrorhabdus sp. Kp2]|uniref:hypothetical protein n=1 Tax=Thiomicrorhabdus sp. Kp2 TaxID=1123518 RepID=UPI00041508C8|nr:hypothetical protein [Thiomicrorhabdus sp. Kp2]